MPCARQQLRVRAKFHNFTTVQNDDAMGVADGGKTVGDDERGAAVGKPHERLLHEPLGFCSLNRRSNRFRSATPAGTVTRKYSASRGCFTSAMTVT